MSRFCPASPKSAFIKNEQKAKTKTFRFRSKGAAIWPLKFTADSPPIYRPFAALFGLNISRRSPAVIHGCFFCRFFAAI
jgi:hypothetical protein